MGLSDSILYTTDASRFDRTGDLFPKQEEAIEIAATQTKSACADWVITGVANPDLVLIIIAAFCIDGNSSWR